MIGFSLPFLLSFGWWAIGIAAVIALFLICLIVYLLALIFTDGDTAVQIAIGVVGCPIGIAIGCFFPGIMIGLLTLCFFDSFVAGVVIGGIIGLFVIVKYIIMDL